jgi:hypothetical protein
VFARTGLRAAYLRFPPDGITSALSCLPDRGSGAATRVPPLPSADLLVSPIPTAADSCSRLLGRAKHVPRERLDEGVDCEKTRRNRAPCRYGVEHSRDGASVENGKLRRGNEGLRTACHERNATEGMVSRAEVVMPGA